MFCEEAKRAGAIIINLARAPQMLGPEPFLQAANQSLIANDAIVNIVVWAVKPAMLDCCPAQGSIPAWQLQVEQAVCGSHLVVNRINKQAGFARRIADGARCKHREFFKRSYIAVD